MSKTTNGAASPAAARPLNAHVETVKAALAPHYAVDVFEPNHALGSGWNGTAESDGAAVFVRPVGGREFRHAVQVRHPAVLGTREVRHVPEVGPVFVFDGIAQGACTVRRLIEGLTQPLSEEAVGAIFASVVLGLQHLQGEALLPPFAQIDPTVIMAFPDGTVKIVNALIAAHNEFSGSKEVARRQQEALGDARRDFHAHTALDRHQKKLQQQYAKLEKKYQKGKAPPPTRFDSFGRAILDDELLTEEQRLSQRFLIGDLALLLNELITRKPEEKITKQLISATKTACKDKTTWYSSELLLFLIELMECSKRETKSNALTLQDVTGRTVMRRFVAELLVDYEENPCFGEAERAEYVCTVFRQQQEAALGRGGLGRRTSSSIGAATNAAAAPHPAVAVPRGDEERPHYGQRHIARVVTTMFGGTASAAGSTQPAAALTKQSSLSGQQQRPLDVAPTETIPAPIIGTATPESQSRTREGSVAASAMPSAAASPRGTTAAQQAPLPGQPQSPVREPAVAQPPLMAQQQGGTYAASSRLGSSNSPLVGQQPRGFNGGTGSVYDEPARQQPPPFTGSAATMPSMADEDTGYQQRSRYASGTSTPRRYDTRSATATQDMPSLNSTRRSTSSNAADHRPLQRGGPYGQDGQIAGPGPTGTFASPTPKGRGPAGAATSQTASPRFTGGPSSSFLGQQPPKEFIPQHRPLDAQGDLSPRGKDLVHHHRRSDIVG